MNGQKYRRYINIIREFYKKSLYENADIYHIHEPELIPIGVLLKKHGKKVIYDAHEHTFHHKWSAQIPLWQKIPETVAAVSFEKAASLLFDGIVAATPTIKGTFPDEKSVTVANFPRLETVNKIEHLPYGDRSNTIVYVGGITEIRGIKEMVQAMSLLPSHLDVRLQIAGKFSTDDLKEEITTMEGWEKVDFHGWVSHDRVFELLGHSKAGLIPFHPTTNNANGLPNKLFEYMAAGLPVIASDFESWEEFIENPPCGRFVDPTDPYEIAEQIEWVFTNQDCAESMGENARKMVESEYNWESQEEKLIKFYHDL